MNECDRDGQGGQRTVDQTEQTPPDRPDITGPLPGYLLLEQLARTGMSEVFRAEEAATGRPVALKIIGPELMRLPGFAARFARESRVAATLRHPHIVDVYETGLTDGGRLGYLAMRFIEGSNLRTLLEERRTLGLDETVAIARQVAAALDAAHARGVVHRDVKPANILLEDGTRRAYLCDFGIAKDAELSSITATSAILGSVLYLSPEQRGNSRDVDHRSDVYSLGCVLYDCLAGLPATPFRGDEIYPVRLLGSPVDRVLRRAMAEDPAQRQASCGELAEELAAAAARAPRLRRLSVALAVGAAAVVTGLVAVAGVALLDRAPDAGALARVPDGLKNDCAAAAEPFPGTESTLSCRDSGGREAMLGFFGDGGSAADAYARLIGESGVARGQGDCAAGGKGAEHRYPDTGPARGRVLCFVRDGRAAIVWADAQARMVGRAEAPVGEAGALLSSWSAWTGADPAFPTKDERGLLDHVAGTACTRASNVDLDSFPVAVAALACTPMGSGAQQVHYYRFASLTDLRASFTERVGEVKAPSGVGCATGDPAGFLGTSRHDWLTVDLGQLLCRPGPDGTLAMEWSMEPLLLAGRVVAGERVGLQGWWAQWHLAPLSRIVEATNAASAPAFPTEAERALLNRIPQPSRLNCVRPSPGQIWADVAAAKVTAVACGRTSGAGLVVYYQFPDVATMRAVFQEGGDSEEACTSLPNGFEANRPYARGDGSTGRLRCGTLDGTGERYLEWTDERYAIAVYAHRGTEPFAMIDWWRHDAGPA